jgi:CBS domain-containing protein
MLVHQIIAEKPSGTIVTIAPEATIEAAISLLSSKRIGAVVVSSDGSAPLGILSERDIVREMGRSGTSRLREPVTALMTADLVSCGKGDSADAVLEKMTEGRFRHMPVMENGQMIGFISIGDVVKARLSELAMEKEALEGMIMGH